MRSASSRIFDLLASAWSGRVTRRVVSYALLAVLLASLLLIELERRDLLPSLPFTVPDNHFAAVEWAVNLLLLVELVDLAFGLAASVAGSLGKQLDIFALIMLRKSFEELRDLPDPINLSALPLAWTFEPEIMPLWNMAADAAGALAIFATVVAYRWIEKDRPISEAEGERQAFVDAKKVVALLLLLGVAILTVRHLVVVATGDPEVGLYPSIFTMFIFSDIVIALLTLRYTNHFRVVFRNFGFALGTVFLRLAITANPLERAAMGIGVALYVLVLSWLFNLADRLAEREAERGEDPERGETVLSGGGSRARAE